MSDANPKPEPSMEEILASIRRIISEDDDPGAKPEESSAEDASDDVLELTDIAEESEEEPAASLEEKAEEPAEPAKLAGNGHAAGGRPRSYCWRSSGSAELQRSSGCATSPRRSASLGSANRRRVDRW